MDWRDYLRAIEKHWWFLATAAALGMSGAALVTFLTLSGRAARPAQAWE